MFNDFPVISIPESKRNHLIFQKHYSATCVLKLVRTYKSLIALIFQNKFYYFHLFFQDYLQNNVVKIHFDCSFRKMALVNWKVLFWPSNTLWRSEFGQRQSLGYSKTLWKFHHFLLLLDFWSFFLPVLQIELAFCVCSQAVCKGSLPLCTGPNHGVVREAGGALWCSWTFEQEMQARYPQLLV